MSNNLPNRKIRRDIAKKAGLLKKKAEMSFEQKTQITQKAIEMGKHIHRRNVENQIRNHENAIIASETKNIQSEETYISSSDDLKAITGALKRLENGNMDS